MKRTVLSILLTSALFAQDNSLPKVGVTEPALIVPAVRLTSFLAALKASDTAPVNVVVFGDSISRCYYMPCANTPTLESSLWVEQLRSYLTNKFGNHGSGIIPLQIGVFGDGAIDTADWTLTGVCVLDPRAGPSEDFTNVSSLYALRSGATATLAPKYGDTAHVYIRQNGSETADGFEATVDGVSAGIFAATLASGPVVIDVPLGTLGKHSIKVAPTTGGILRLYGIEITAGTHGVSVHNVSEGGCRADCFGGDPTVQEAFTDIIPGGVQLSIIALGTNDAIGNVPPASYQANLTSLVTHLTRLPKPGQVIILNEPWMSPESGANQTPYYAAALAVAQATSVISYDAPTDFFKSFSNQQLKKWMGSSNVHLTDAGSQQYGQWILGQMFGVQGNLPGTTGRQAEPQSK